MISVDSSQDTSLPVVHASQSPSYSISKNKKKKKTPPVADPSKYLISKPSIPRNTRNSKKALGNQKGGSGVTETSSDQ